MNCKIKQTLKKVMSLVLPLFAVFTMYGQQSISGTISDENGPLPGATVVIKGTTNGVQTDFDGNFTLADVNDGDTLEFSYIGYQTIEMSYDQNMNPV